MTLTLSLTPCDAGFALAPKDGPYGVLLPSEFSRRNPGLRFWNGTRAARLRVGFQPEIGSISVPTFRSLRRWMSPEAPPRPQYHVQYPYYPV